MSNPIKYSDVFNPDFEKGLNIAVEAAENLKSSLLEIANMSAKTANTTPLGSYDELKKILDAQKKFTDAQKGIIEVEKQLIALEREKEKLKAEGVKTTIEEEKLAGAKIKNTIAETKEKERLLKQQEKEARERTRMNSLYAQESKRLNELRNKYKDLVLAGKENEKSTKDLRKEITSLDGKLKDVDASVGQFQRNVGNYTSAFDALPGALGRSSQAAKELGVQFIKLLKNPIVIAIATISAALLGLFKAFKSTDSGGTEFAVRMEQVSAIVDVLRQRAVLLTDGLKSIFSGNILEGLRQIGGVFSGISEQVNKAVEGSRKYIEALDKLEDSESNYVSVSADNANKIAKLEFIAANRTLSLEQRRNALKEAIRLSEEEAKQAEKYARMRLDIEAEYIADKNGLDKQAVLNFIKLSDQEQANASKALVTARNNNEEKFKELEQFYKKSIDSNTAFFEENKKNNAKLSAFEEEILKERKKFIDEVDKLSFGTETAKRKREIEILESKLNESRESINANYSKLSADENVFNSKKVNRLKSLYEIERQLAGEATAQKIALLEADAERNTRAIKESEDSEELKKEKIISINEQFLIELEKLREEGVARGLAINEQELESLEKIEQKKKDIILETAQNVTSELSSELANRNNLIQKELDREISAREKSIETQTRLAENGQANILAFEEKKRAEAELRKRQQEERAQKEAEILQLTEAYFNFLNSRSKVNPESAPYLALKDTLLAKGIAKGISGFFFEGTEKVADDLKGNKVHNGRDGYVIAVDGSERILTGEQNASLSGISNEKLVSIATAYKSGLNNIYQSNSTQRNIALHEYQSFTRAINEIKEVIMNKRETHVNLDNLGNVIETSVENNMRTVVKKITRKNRL